MSTLKPYFEFVSKCKALVESSSFTASFPRLYLACCGIVFFGAPHRGLNNPELETLVQGKPPDDLVRDLRPNSSLLSSLNRSFPDTCEDIRIVSCYETEHTLTYQAKDPNNTCSKWEKTGPPRFIVPPTSACLHWPKPREVMIAISADHSDMAKIHNMAGSAYYLIEDEIEQILCDAPGILKRRKDMYSAPENTLSLLFMLQYEYHWLLAWLSHKSRDPPRYGSSAGMLMSGIDESMFSVISYEDPAFSIIDSIRSILDVLSDLLKKHCQQPVLQGSSARPQRTDIDERAASLPTQNHMASIRFSLTSKRNYNYLVTDTEHDHHVYEIENWNDSDREQFTYWLSRLTCENGRLSQLSRHAISLGLIASSKVLDVANSNFHAIEHTSNPEIASSLWERASLKDRFEKNTSEDPPLYPLSRLEMRDGTGASNYRMMTSLDNKIPSGALGETRSIKTSMRSFGLVIAFSQAGADNQIGFL